MVVIRSEDLKAKKHTSDFMFTSFKENLNFHIRFFLSKMGDKYECARKNLAKRALCDLL